MKLSFECSRDPKSMPTINGKKFCDHCQKQVHDLRRKSTEKVALFYAQNPSACVIAYGDQLEKLPKRQITTTQRYFPYAAAIIAVSLLPTLTIAQVSVQPNIQMIGNMPIAIPIVTQEGHVIDKKEVVAKSTEKYFIEGKVTIIDKKLKARAGKEILVYKVLYDSKGNYLREDTLALGKLEMNGKFKMEVTKETFGLLRIDEEEINFSVDGFNYEEVENIDYSGNTAKVAISVSARRRLMGAF